MVPARQTQLWGLALPMWLAPPAVGSSGLMVAADMRACLAAAIASTARWCAAMSAGSPGSPSIIAFVVGTLIDLAIIAGIILMRSQPRLRPARTQSSCSIKPGGMAPRRSRSRATSP